MPTEDLFGNPVYSKEELKELQKKEKEEQEKKLAAEKEKAAKKEAEQKLKASKKKLKEGLEKLISNEEDMPENADEIQTDIESIDDATLEEIQALEKKYKKQLSPAKEKVDKKYKYPFIMHIAGRNIETDHIFEAEKEYTEKEITASMLAHQYYDFAGTVSYEYLQKENVLIPIFQQHKKG